MRDISQSFGTSLLIPKEQIFQANHAPTTLDVRKDRDNGNTIFVGLRVQDTVMNAKILGRFGRPFFRNNVPSTCFPSAIQLARAGAWMRFI